MTIEFQTSFEFKEEKSDDDSQDHYRNFNIKQEQEFSPNDSSQSVNQILWKCQSLKTNPIISKQSSASVIFRSQTEMNLEHISLTITC